MIYKTFFNIHIDLDKIVSISDAYFINRSFRDFGHGVAFDIHIQLLNKPIHYERELTYEEQNQDTCNPILIDNNKIYSGHNIDDTNILAVQNLQKQVDEIIQAWKECNNECVVTGINEEERMKQFISDYKKCLEIL